MIFILFWIRSMFLLPMFRAQKQILTCNASLPHQQLQRLLIQMIIFLHRVVHHIRQHLPTIQDLFQNLEKDLVHKINLDQDLDPDLRYKKGMVLLTHQANVQKFFAFIKTNHFTLHSFQYFAVYQKKNLYSLSLLLLLHILILIPLLLASIMHHPSVFFLMDSLLLLHLCYCNLLAVSPYL